MSCFSGVLRFQRIEVCKAALDADSVPEFVKLAASKYRIIMLIHQATEDKATIDNEIKRAEKSLAAHLKNYNAMVNNESFNIETAWERSGKVGINARVTTEWPSFLKRLIENKRIRKTIESQLILHRAESINIETSIMRMGNAKTKINPTTIKSKEAISQLFADLNQKFGTTTEANSNDQEEIFQKNQESSTNAAIAAIPDQASETAALQKELLAMMTSRFTGANDGDRRERRGELESDDDADVEDEEEEEEKIKYVPQ